MRDDRRLFQIKSAIAHGSLKCGHITLKWNHENDGQSAALEGGCAISMGRHVQFGANSIVLSLDSNNSAVAQGSQFGSHETVSWFGPKPHWPNVYSDQDTEEKCSGRSSVRHLSCATATCSLNKMVLVVPNDVVWLQPDVNLHSY